MQLVVGLGNPGPRYAATRHNLGFGVVDALATRWGAVFRTEPHYLAATAAGPAGPVTLLKPLTYMNRSGEAVVAWADGRGVAVSGLPPATATDEAEPPIVPVVVCDDLALPLGSLRIRAQGSAGGQKGLASVIAAVGGDCLPRVRLGIAGCDQIVAPEQWSDYVLAPFTEDEQSTVADLISRAAAAVVLLLAEGPGVAAETYNRTIRSLLKSDQSDILPP